MKLVRSGKHYFLLCLLALLGCRVESIDLESMSASESSFNERQKQQLIVYMSLETMFPNRQVRALAEAAGNGELKKIDEIIAKGVDVNSRGTKDATPLFWAMRNLDGFQKLLDLGADPNIVFSDSSVMHWAAMHEDVSFLIMAIRYGGNPNLTAGKFNETPLFKTIGVKGSDNRKAMLILLESGADINARTSGEVFGVPMGGKTPVMVAADLGRFDIVYELLGLGADYSLQDDNGRGLVERINSMDNAFIGGSDSAKWYNETVMWLKKRKP